MEYIEFRKQYEERHRASMPVMEEVISEYPGWLKWIVLIMFVSAALLSGVHTVPTVRAGIEQGGAISDTVRDAVSLLSFVAVELAIFVSAYMMTREDNRLAWITLILASAVAIVANLHSVSKALQSDGELGATIVGVILGICLPAIALAAGKMFVNMHRSDRVADARARKKYREECIAFDERVLSAYDEYTKKQHRRTRTAAVRSVSERTAPDGQRGQSSGYGHSRTTDAKDLVQKYLEDNPAAFELSVRALADELGVGKSTVAEVRRMMAAAESANGHHNGHNNGSGNSEAQQE